MKSPRRIFLGWSGASGSIYGIRTLQMLVDAGVSVDLCLSEAAKRVLHLETDFRFDGDPHSLMEGRPATGVRVHQEQDIGAAPASGSSRVGAVLVVPCSLSTVAGIAGGSARTLIERAAQVALKEDRPLVIMPRETPLSRLHLDLLSRLAWAGATILPACPGFYHRPKTILELVDPVCARVLAKIGVATEGVPVWEGMSPTSRPC